MSRGKPGWGAVPTNSPPQLGLKFLPPIEGKIAFLIESHSKTFCCLGSKLMFEEKKEPNSPRWVRGT